MTTPLETRRIVIAGASSLLGTELKSLLEESRFAASELRLVDEESVAGQLTAAAGEPAFIQPVEEDSFNRAWAVFFTGSPAFTRRNLELAQKSGARVVDLSGAVTGRPDAQVWFRKMPERFEQSFHKNGKLFAVPSAAGEIISRLSLLTHSKSRGRLHATAFQPVSAAGKQGIEELESQTGQLLSFQPIGQSVFDTQVAFNVLSRFGSSSAHSLQSSLETLRNEVHAALPSDIAKPAIQLLHAPVFYGTAVLASAEIADAAFGQALAQGCAQAGFTITHADQPPSNLSVAGESTPHLAPPQPDLAETDAWWFWAAADNIRLPAANAVKLAEKLLG